MRIREWKTAAQIEPDFAEAHYNLGIVLATQPGRLPEAISELQTTVRIRPGNADAHYKLAEALVQTPGREAEAVAEFEAAMRIAPNPQEQEKFEKLRHYAISTRQRSLPLIFSRSVLPLAIWRNSATSGLKVSPPIRKRPSPIGSSGVVPSAHSLPFLSTMRVERNHGTIGPVMPDECLVLLGRGKLLWAGIASVHIPVRSMRQLHHFPVAAAEDQREAPPGIFVGQEAIRTQPFERDFLVSRHDAQRGAVRPIPVACRRTKFRRLRRSRKHF